jgi:hypothetical protein
MDAQTRAYLRQLQQQLDTLRSARDSATFSPGLPSDVRVVRLHEQIKDANQVRQGGKYLGRVLRGDSEDTFSGTHALPHTGMQLDTTDLPVMVVNLAEVNGGGVPLAPTDTRPIWVLALRIGVTSPANRPLGGNGVPIYAFAGPADANVLVRITGDGGYGGGKYAGKIIVPPAADVVTAGTLTVDDFGADGETCIVFNAQEIGSNTHWLTNAANTSQKTFLGRVIRRQADGTAVVAINGLWAKICS